MDTNQPASPPVYTPAASASPGIFGTKIPSTVAFAVAVLLFFMPFIDIKCNNMSLQTVSGFELAKGFKTKSADSGNSFMKDTELDKPVEGAAASASKSEDKKPNLYALIAMGLGVVGLLLSFTNAKAAIGGAMVTGIASAGALIGLMIDVKKSVKESMPAMGSGSGGTDGTGALKEGLDKFSQSMDNVKITVDFTPWFYIAVVAFLAAAFFCYKRMTDSKR